MAHFAELGDNGQILRVVVVSNAELLENGVESEAKGIQFLAGLYGHARWAQTSYSGSFRKRYAGVGYAFDSVRDAFIPPQPFPSWVLNEQTCAWAAPKPLPDLPGPWSWDEATGDWVKLAQPQDS